MFKNNISIIGGTGHVGLPLGIAFSKRKFKVNLIKKVNRGILPFMEKNASKALKVSIKKKKNICNKQIIVFKIK